MGRSGPGLRGLHVGRGGVQVQDRGSPSKKFEQVWGGGAILPICTQLSIDLGLVHLLHYNKGVSRELVVAFSHSTYLEYACIATNMFVFPGGENTL